ncbi:MAG: hypothetical protein ABFS21_03050 [Actinomycetota bacterium]
MRDRTHLVVGLAAVLALLVSSRGGAASEIRMLDESMGWHDFDEEAAHLSALSPGTTPLHVEGMACRATAACRGRRHRR